MEAAMAEKKTGRKEQGGGGGGEGGQQMTCVVVEDALKVFLHLSHGCCAAVSFTLVLAPAGPSISYFVFSILR
jgi:hypothetical protein